MALNVLIVDDSVIYRKVLTEVVTQMPEAEVAAAVSSGSLALRRLEKGDIDLVLLDIEMPELDGLQTLERIKKQGFAVETVMVSGTTEKGSSVTIKALNLGALDFVRKPKGATPEDSRQQLLRDFQPIMRVLRTRTLLRGRGKVATPTAGEETQAAPQRSSPAAARPRLPSSFGIVGIGVSTGGPKALTELLPQLPADLPLPVLVVQHMPAMFTAALAKDLNRKSALEIKEAQEGDDIRAGRVLIAPGGCHLVVRKGGAGMVASLTDTEPENSCRPAVDVLFRSLADHYGSAGVLSVILTGMGSDGLKGVEALKRKCCYCLAQSAASCVVYSMPQAVDNANLSDESVDLQQMANRINQLARRGR